MHTTAPHILDSSKGAYDILCIGLDREESLERELTIEFHLDVGVVCIDTGVSAIAGSWNFVSVCFQGRNWAYRILRQARDSCSVVILTQLTSLSN